MMGHRSSMSFQGQLNRLWHQESIETQVQIFFNVLSEKLIDICTEAFCSSKCKDFDFLILNQI